MAAEVFGDAWRRPTRVGKQDDFQAIASGSRQVGVPQRVQFRTGSVIKMDAYHALLYAAPASCLALARNIDKPCRPAEPPARVMPPAPPFAPAAWKYVRRPGSRQRERGPRGASWAFRMW